MRYPNPTARRLTLSTSARKRRPECDLDKYVLWDLVSGNIIHFGEFSLSSYDLLVWALPTDIPREIERKNLGVLFHMRLRLRSQARYHNKHLAVAAVV